MVDESAFEGEGRHVDGAALSLVAEFTSVSTKDVDWHEKLDVYGQLVPVYLVADMQASEITCFSDSSPHRVPVPQDGAFRCVPAPSRTPSASTSTARASEAAGNARGRHPPWGVPPSFENSRSTRGRSQGSIRSPCRRPACRPGRRRRPSRACRR
ncbi:hypothetical protein PV721_15585 [Streptomyces sp. MB09-01]|uniref:hypothetical protein n=1 Tax=Streptomyces sp. MB09-01 TaxID=3028666 RepID=UPI0029A81D3F|nr:hypothetical protein [Streptomyces sp. MB09-01]MDX3535758.1 hypothetical protein [Streptomyces sp. MB09-01]